MTAISLKQTAHSKARIRQRGLREADAALVFEWGAELRSGVFMMTDRVADEIMAELSHLNHRDGGSVITDNAQFRARLKRHIDALRRCVVVAEGVTLVTAFHKKAPHLRTDPRSDPHCRRRRQRCESERRKRSFNPGMIIP
jgi:hypothetical protein